MKNYTFLFLFSLFCVIAAPDVSFSQEKHEIDISATDVLATIAVPNFSRHSESLPLKPGALSKVIYRDLELSGFFRKPENQEFVNQTSRSDIRNEKIDFKEWRRLGSSFLVKGTYLLTPEELSAQCFLYDVKTNQRIFGKKFTGFKKKDYRRLAHQISDEIVKYIAHVSGIASTKIVFISDRGSDKNNKEVFIMDADGYNQRPLTGDGSLAATPCWGARGTEIYYTSYKEYNPDLWVIRLKDGKTGVVSSYPGFNLSPAWSPESKRIALTLSKDGNSEIYIMGPRGENLKRITFHKAIDSSPCWSPDGEQIVFTSDRTGMPQVYLTDSEGLDVKRLTFKGSYNDSPVWSPKGDKIAYVSRSSGYFHIFLMNEDGSNRIQLSSGRSNNEDPCWAPDGEHLAFTSDRTGKTQIYMMNIRTAEPVQLTFEGSNQSPAWSPYFK